MAQFGEKISQWRINDSAEPPSEIHLEREMKIDGTKGFWRGLSGALTQTIDGLSALLWCCFFVGKAACMIAMGHGLLTALGNILLIPVIVLFVIRLRINEEDDEKFNLGAFISVNFISAIYLTREVL